MITREEVLKYVGYICKRDFQAHEAEIIAHICKYIQQGPDPDAALWAEIDELLKKLNKESPGNALELVRANFPISGVHWLIVTRPGDAMDGWVPVGSSGWKPVPTIRDQLRELATKRGLLTPSREEMAEITKGFPNAGHWHLPPEQVAKFKAFFATEVAEGGE